MTSITPTRATANLTPQQKKQVEKAVKLTVKKYRKTLIRLAAT